MLTEYLFARYSVNTVCALSHLDLTIPQETDMRVAILVLQMKEPRQ